MSGGRPTKRSPERELAILNALRVGNTRTASCAAAEVSLDSLARWMEADAEFRGAVVKAEANAELRFLGQVAKAAAGQNWQAAAWWLERRRHEHYRRREGVEVTGHGGGPIQTMVMDELDDHEKRALRGAIDRELARREAEGSPVKPRPAVRQRRPARVLR